ncbi:hypothetical protein B484DRAFT_410008 [Ochromonadaceae sp. CCMP2298]|nr:hypothetical protein B484DRAFT_410008 [Ochromonadaceae sp. CCMP2298]
MVVALATTLAQMGGGNVNIDTFVATQGSYQFTEFYQGFSPRDRAVADKADLPWVEALLYEPNGESDIHLIVWKVSTGTVILERENTECRDGNRSRKEYVDVHENADLFRHEVKGAVSTMLERNRNDFLVWDVEQSAMQIWTGTSMIRHFWCMPEIVIDVGALLKERLAWFDKKSQTTSTEYMTCGRSAEAHPLE